MSDENSDLRKRLADIQNQVQTETKTGNAAKYAGVGAACLVLGVGGVIGYNSLQGGAADEVAIPSTVVQEFPEDRAAQESLELPAPPDPILIDRPVVEFQTDSATLARLADLEEELEAAQALIGVREGETEQERALREELQRERDAFASELAALRSAAENDQDRSRETIEQLQASVTAIRTQVSDGQRELIAQQTGAQQQLLDQSTQFQEELRAARQQLLQQAEDFQLQLREARAVDPLEQERLRLLEEEMRREAEERERFAAQRAEREAAEQARVQSGLLALNNTGVTEAGAGGGEGRELSANESFVQRGVQETPVSRATQIASPHATVPQGSIIQAALETAIDSSLPGAIRAVVSEDVHSLDGSAVLIPAGSKVFGEYSSGIALGQERVLIVWTRILTPTNRSVNISSYGGDELGRSGTSGIVDTRFGTRFGGAALISIIGSLPSAVASNQENSDLATILGGVGESLSGATDTAIGEYLSIPPSIYVHQGEAVSIIVDRDLEIF